VTIAAGAKLGRYEIRAKIGEGVMVNSFQKRTHDNKSGVKPPHSK
jgi:hypothetical protein